MKSGIFISGTDTDVGKSVVSAMLLYMLRENGINACYFKAALSGAMRVGDNLIPGDGRFVLEVAGIKEKYDRIIPHIYETPVSPHLAGRIECDKVRPEKVISIYNELKKDYDYILVEGAGGLIVPLNDQGYMTKDLINDLDLDVILVSRAGVGTINHTSLSMEYAKNVGINIKGIILNGYSRDNIAHVDNAEIIEKLNDTKIIMKIPKLTGVDVEKNEFGNLKETCIKLMNKEIIEGLR
ncbi:dethiobiotin synthase [Oceanirhabdus sp. W0125-5]|uniref:dethiobiotin synthase n=1 Tax=Oceanirhabdus sp. W0125-5 TaxID=2999116 RepID=UPI0022F3298B|nr:dethiobiotin synthase [Oceanirhabdus sp. W0125-5]WBW99516.1 dethiobiotin synthase [Oceanirhabdus sp. W0125-5]